MPCTMYADATTADFAYSAAQDAQKKSAELELLLCDMLRRLQELGIKDEVLTNHETLQRWAVKHRAEDLASFKNIAMADANWCKDRVNALVDAFTDHLIDLHKAYTMQIDQAEFFKRLQNMGLRIMELKCV